MHSNPLYRSSLQAKIMITLFALMLFSCSKQTDKGIQTVNILEVPTNEFSISKIAEEVTYLPLSSDSILAYIMNVVYFDGEYFVKDNKSKFLRFDSNGQVLNQIGQRGNGPGEYRYVSDFVIHPTTGNIYVSGGKPGQLMVFSKDGKFIKPIKLTKKYVSSIGISGENLFLFYFDGAEHVPESIEQLDAEGNLINSYPNKYKFERNRANVGFSGEYLTYKFQEKLHFKEVFSDTVFYADGMKMIPKLILNSEDKRFTPDIRTELIRAISVDRQASAKIFSEVMPKYVTQRNLMESSRYYFYSYDFNHKTQTLLIDKADGTLKKFDTEAGITNDMDGGPNITLKSKIDTKTIISWIHAYELKEYVASEAFKNSTPLYPEKKKELEQLANSLDENDNPVLMLVKLKE